MVSDVRVHLLFTASSRYQRAGVCGIHRAGGDGSGRHGAGSARLLRNPGADVRAGAETVLSRGKSCDGSRRLLSHHPVRRRDGRRPLLLRQASSPAARWSTTPPRPRTIRSPPCRSCPAIGEVSTAERTSLAQNTLSRWFVNNSYDRDNERLVYFRTVPDQEVIDGYAAACERSLSRGVFNNNDLVILRHTTAARRLGLDSLMHVRLVLAREGLWRKVGQLYRR